MELFFFLIKAEVFNQLHIRNNTGHTNNSIFIYTYTIKREKAWDNKLINFKFSCYILLPVWRDKAASMAPFPGVFLVYCKIWPYFDFLHIFEGETPVWLHIIKHQTLECNSLKEGGFVTRPNCRLLDQRKMIRHIFWPGPTLVW